MVWIEIDWSTTLPKAFLFWPFFALIAVVTLGGYEDVD